MNAREFFDAVVEMRSAGKAYYACKLPLTDPHKKELLESALNAEKKVDNEICRVLEILSNKNVQKLQQELNLK